MTFPDGPAKIDQFADMVDDGSDDAFCSCGPNTYYQIRTKIVGFRCGRCGRDICPPIERKVNVPDIIPKSIGACLVIDNIFKKVMGEDWEKSEVTDPNKELLLELRAKLFEEVGHFIEMLPKEGE